ncbi:hypothetical protein HU200_015669 [Digitaria exilis]|uniref:Cytochrome P450 n=1 Tax=Digitaria exilis TaxID=1010633 RepID=A0A835F8M8_9POAL|nr:hypothetical protein HU200_015669 [Digitaria exilis]
MPLHLILSFPFLIITVVYLVRSARRPGCATASSSSLRRLPPGPWALPVMGHLHHLMLDALPHHKLRDLSRHHGPVMLLRLGELPVVVVSSVDAAREVMKTNDLTFATWPIGQRRGWPWPMEPRASSSPPTTTRGGISAGSAPSSSSAPAASAPSTPSVSRKPTASSGRWRRWRWQCGEPQQVRVGVRG